MKKLMWVVIILLIIVGYMWWVGAPPFNKPATPASDTMQKTGSSEAVMAKNTVEIKGFAYNPRAITVKVGDTVTWTNKDLVGHSATADDGSFDTGVLAQGKSGTATFTKAGTFSYHCTPHPNIKGTVIVQ